MIIFISYVCCIDNNSGAYVCHGAAGTYSARTLIYRFTIIYSWTLEKIGKRRVCGISDSWGNEHKGRSYAMYHFSYIHERRGSVLIGAGTALGQIE